MRTLLTVERMYRLQTVLAALGKLTVLIDSLVISNTAIVELPAGAFADLAIKRLVLRNNGLDRNQSQSYTHVPKSGMTTIHPQAFDNSALAQTLTELEIRHNSLGEVPQSGLVLLRALRTLVLSKCGIHTVPPNAFATYSSRTLINRLDLSANRLQRLAPDALR